MHSSIQSILDFWFGPLTEDSIPQDKWQLWFASKAEDDATIHENFSPLITQALAGELSQWQDSLQGKVAHILLCDQMTRATRRGTPEAFAGDSIARGITLSGIRDKEDKHLPAAHRLFFYLPLEHSEDIAMQKLSITCYRQLLDDFPLQSAILQRSLEEATAHHDLIERFGRFPHRNAILGRENTPAEADYLATTHNHYGQSPR